MRPRDYVCPLSTCSAQHDQPCNDPNTFLDLDYYHAVRVNLACEALSIRLQELKNRLDNFSSGYNP